MPRPELRALIAEQSRDDQTWRLRRHEFTKHEIRVADLDTAADPDRGRRILEGAPARGLDALPSWRIASLRASQHADDRIRASVLIGFTPTWTGEIAHFDPARGRPCPCCGGTCDRSDLGRGKVCVVCSGMRRHPIQEPMQEVSDKFDPGRRAKLGLPPLRTRMQRLKGGVGSVT